MGLEERGKGEEAAYKHDQERMFKIRNRRNKLFGVWLAETHLGKSGEATAEYAREVVLADFDKPGDDDVYEKVRKDLEEAGVELSDHLLEKHLKECEIEARSQIMNE